MLFDGLLNLPWWGCILAVLALTHVTIASVTIYLHRCQAHRALELHPTVSHFFADVSPLRFPRSRPGSGISLTSSFSCVADATIWLWRLPHLAANAPRASPQSV